MYLQQLSVINFKNYSEAELNFSEGVNAFTGNNGAGKTNLLDAIHYLSLCKSYFNPIDSQQIKTGTDMFVINGIFNKDGNKETIACGLKRNQKKQFKRNKKDYQRLADHIGLFPLVMISPYDISIIIEGSEERRKFIDNVISQTDNKYLDELITYNKVLINRNALLKRIADSGRYDPDLLNVFDEQLIASGNLIFEKRKAFMARNASKLFVLRPLLFAFRCCARRIRGPRRQCGRLSGLGPSVGRACGRFLRRVPVGRRAQASGDRRSAGSSGGCVRPRRH